MKAESSLLIISGVSGAGKTMVLDYLEDHGYFCVDNLPLELLSKFVELLLSKEESQKAALVVDVREREFLGRLDEVFAFLGGSKIKYSVFYLDCEDEILIRRFKETRRHPPLLKEGETMEESLNRERELLKPIKLKADILIDTTGYTPQELREYIRNIFFPGEEILINLIAFGFKNGIPREADIIWDVRFLPNPYWIPALKELTGEDPRVRDFVLSNPPAGEFLEKFKEMMERELPLFKKEGKTFLNVALGCTGGRHRSVVIVEELFKWLREKGYRVNRSRRDI
ncbi:MAG TPA: RNase adapter RapZ [bacterium]|nr:RNase adapter RapZ [bacterium]